MHELAVAQEILAMVRRHVPDALAPAVRSVHLRVGDEAGIVAASLEFCFEAIVAGTPWERAALVIARVPARARCADCGDVFATATPGAGCPSCGSGQVRMVSGQELHVDAVDLDDAVEATVGVGASGEAVTV